MTTLKKKRQGNPERLMLFIFPGITLTLFMVGLLILWVINHFVFPAV